MSESNKLYFSPKPVQHYHDFLQQGLPANLFIGFRRAYIRNISYSLQYMEYLKYSFTSLPAHTVIESQLIKTYVITGSSIVESILWMLLKGNNLNKQVEWKQLQRRETNQFKELDQEYKFEVTHYRKLEKPIDVEMKYSELCRKAEASKILGVSSSLYSKLNHLRKLRNRIHIHDVQHDRDNDFWTFSRTDMELMEDSIISILKSQIFDPCPNYEHLFVWLDSSLVESQT